MSEWYYMSGGQQNGPVTAAQLKSLASSGGLVPEDLVWNQSMPEWVPARRVKGLPFAGAGAGAQSPAPVRAAARAAAVAAPARPAAEPEPLRQSFEAAPADTSAPEESEHEQAAPAQAEETPRAKASGTHAQLHRGVQAVPTHAVELFAKTRGPVALMSLLTFLLMLVALAATAFTAGINYDKAGKFLTAAIRARGYSLKLHTDMPHLIVYGSYTLIGLIMLFLLRGYSSKIKKLLATYGSDELENAMRAQARLWKFMLLVLFVTIVVVVLRHLHYVMQVM